MEVVQIQSLELIAAINSLAAAIDKQTAIHQQVLSVIQVGGENLQTSGPIIQSTLAPIVEAITLLTTLTSSLVPPTVPSSTPTS
jgi:hypothetical protein